MKIQDSNKQTFPMLSGDLSGLFEDWVIGVVITTSKYQKSLFCVSVGFTFIYSRRICSSSFVGPLSASMLSMAFVKLQQLSRQLRKRTTMRLLKPKMFMA